MLLAAIEIMIHLEVEHRLTATTAVERLTSLQDSCLDILGVYCSFAVNAVSTWQPEIAASEKYSSKLYKLIHPQQQHAPDVTNLQKHDI